MYTNSKYTINVSAAQNDARVFRLGINGTVITLRAVSHRATMYWIEVRYALLYSIADILQSVISLNTCASWY